MPRRKRDYQVEYARRIAKGLSRGLSRAQARGHPAPTETSGSGQTPSAPYSRKLETGLRVLWEGKSLAAAAKSIRVAPETLRRYLQAQGVAERRRGRWVPLSDRRSRRMLLYTQGTARTVTVSRPAASEIGAYMANVSSFLESNDIAYLQPFEGRVVIDINGVAHPFETDPNTLYRLAHSGDETFEYIYRIIP